MNVIHEAEYESTSNIDAALPPIVEESSHEVFSPHDSLYVIANLGRPETEYEMVNFSETPSVSESVSELYEIFALSTQWRPLSRFLDVFKVSFDLSRFDYIAAEQELRRVMRERFGNVELLNIRSDEEGISGQIVVEDSDNYDSQLDEFTEIVAELYEKFDLDFNFVLLQRSHLAE